MQHYYLWTKNVLEKKSVIQYFFFLYIITTICKRYAIYSSSSSDSSELSHLLCTVRVESASSTFSSFGFFFLAPKKQAIRAIRNNVPPPAAPPIVMICFIFCFCLYARSSTHSWPSPANPFTQVQVKEPLSFWQTALWWHGSSSHSSMSTIVTREYKQKQKSKTKENIWTDIQVDGAGFKVMCVTHPKNIQPLSSWGEEGQGGSQPSTFRTTFTRLPVHLCLLASRLPLIY